MNKLTAILIGTVVGTMISLAAGSGMALADTAKGSAFDRTSYARHLSQIGPVKDGRAGAWATAVNDQCSDAVTQGDDVMC